MLKFNMKVGFQTFLKVVEICGALCYNIKWKLIILMSI